MASSLPRLTTVSGQQYIATSCTWWEVLSHPDSLANREQWRQVAPTLGLLPRVMRLHYWKGFNMLLHLCMYCRGDSWRAVGVLPTHMFWSNYRGWRCSRDTVDSADRHSMQCSKSSLADSDVLTINMNLYSQNALKSRGEYKRLLYSRGMCRKLS